MSAVLEPTIKPRVNPTRRRSSVILWRQKSILRMNEQQRKAAKYEAMIQRFQIRRVEGNSSVESKMTSKDIVVDKRFNSAQQNWKHFSFRRFVRKMKKKATKILPSSLSTLNAPARSTSFMKTVHGVIMYFVMHFLLFYLPFAPIFYPTGSTDTIRIDMALELLTIIDISMTFNTANGIRQSDPVAAKRRVASRYLRGWFIFDAISALPVQSFKTAVYHLNHQHPLSVHSSSLMLIRLIRLRFRGTANLINDRVSVWIKYSRYTHLFRIIRLLWLVLVIAHYMTCFWYLLTHRDWHDGSTVVEQYIANYFYAVSLIHGQGNISDHWGQNLLATCFILIGSVIVATIFGNVAMLVSNFNANATNYQRKMESVFATMDKMELPDRLRDRIQQYYAHIWAEYKSLDGDLVKFQRELTHTLGLEVGLYKYMSLVNDIHFWIDCSPDFIAQIVLALVVRVYLPDDYVVREGEICDEMFMINRGVCEISKMDESTSEYLSVCGISSRNTATLTGERSGSHDYGRVGSAEHIARIDPTLNDCSDGIDESEHVLSLRHGQSFGEMNLLMNYGQPSSVRAISFVEICVLERISFQRIISRYPTDRRRVLRSILGTCIQKKETPLEWDRLCLDQLQRKRGCANLCGDPVSIDMLSLNEVVNLLVDKADAERPNNTIVYGFHSATTGETSDSDGFSAIQETAGNLIEPRSISASPSSTSSKSSEVEIHDTDSSSQNLCNKMLTMILDLTATVERIERSQREHQQICSRGKSPLSADPITDHNYDDQQTARTGYSNASQQALSHLVINSLENESPGSPSFSGSATRRTIPLSNLVTPLGGGIFPSNGPRDSPLPQNSSQSIASARSMQHGFSTPPMPEEMTNPLSGAIAHRLASMDAANLHVMRATHRASVSVSSDGRQTGSRPARVDKPVTRAKMKWGISTRARAPIGASRGAKPLRLRFLTSRMSSPSGSLGTSWGIAKPTKETTLADQLWERRRKHSREVITYQEASGRDGGSRTSTFPLAPAVEGIR